MWENSARKLLLWIIFSLCFENRRLNFVFSKRPKKMLFFFSSDNRHCLKSICWVYSILFSHYVSVLMAPNSNAVLLSLYFIFHGPILLQYKIRIFVSVLFCTRLLALRVTGNFFVYKNLLFSHFCCVWIFRWIYNIKTYTIVYIREYFPVATSKSLWRN